MSERSARPRLDHYKGRSILKERENPKGAARSARGCESHLGSAATKSHVMTKQSVRATRCDSSGRGPPARDTEMMKRGCTMELSLASPVGKTYEREESEQCPLV